MVTLLKLHPRLMLSNQNLLESRRLRLKSQLRMRMILMTQMKMILMMMMKVLMRTCLELIVVMKMVRTVRKRRTPQRLRRTPRKGPMNLPQKLLSLLRRQSKLLHRRLMERRVPTLQHHTLQRRAERLHKHPILLAAITLAKHAASHLTLMALFRLTTRPSTALSRMRGTCGSVARL